MLRLLWSGVSILLVSVTAMAQEYPRVELFGGYSILRPNIPGDIGGSGSAGAAVKSIGEFVLGNVLGWGASATVNFNRTLGITADFGGHYKSLDTTFERTRVDASAHLHTFLFGPKITMAGDRVSPFVQALFGVGKVGASAKVNGDSTDFDKSGFAASVGGGVDVVAHRNVAVRAIEFDYFPFRNGDGKTFTFNNIRWRSGVVFRFMP